MTMIEEAISGIAPLDRSAMEEATARQEMLTKPVGSLGRLEKLSVQLAGITGNPRPTVERKLVITMAGDHGVAAEGVSAFPVEVTPQMVHNFLSGGAAVNVLARQAGARVCVVDMGIACDMPTVEGLRRRKISYGTGNIALGPAMSREQAVRAIEAGIGVVEEEMAAGLDLVATGDMGIANTTPSSAVTAAVTGASAAEVTGRGTGISDESLSRKIEVIERALQVNRPDPNDGLDVLAKVGGFEIGGLAGVIIGAAANRIPVVVDGFISGAAMLIALVLAPEVKPYLIASHRSVEGGHTLAMRWAGLEPLLDLDMRLGEGTGAVLSMHIVEAACRILDEMATFASAGVSAT
ncbi:MAG: nicotinate-nucleotide--dimethylbenzimidazole phosphoribosyltransferase [bacterium]|nr:nicotinate-nucleotide--dimethylbenzimidazole phosphoribosyltransferase [bacterium]